MEGINAREGFELSEAVDLIVAMSPSSRWRLALPRPSDISATAVPSSPS